MQNGSLRARTAFFAALIAATVGTAPKRNRIKRLLREAFRLGQHDLPRGYDIVINVRPHETVLLADYQRLLSAAMIKLHQKWMEKEKAKTEDGR